MPPKRAATVDAKASEKSSSAEKTVQDLYFEKMHKVRERCKMEGYVIITGIDEEDDEESDEEDDAEESESGNKKRKITSDEKKFEGFRIVFVNKSRSAAFKKAQKFVTGGQGGMCMFNTNSGNMLIDDIPDKVETATKLKTSAAKFDALLGLTYHLYDFDYWFHDNELWEEDGDCSKALKFLAAAWKKLLELSDAELGK
jgi:hypothetical protein